MSSLKLKPLSRSLVVLAAAAFFVAAFAPLASGQTAKRPIALDDLFKIKSVGSPQRSPDGKWVAYTVGTTDLEKVKRNSDLWMVGWDGGEKIRLTSSPDGESAPRWSPDGRYLSFLAPRGTEEEKKLGAQVWLLHRRGGEASALTLRTPAGEFKDIKWPSRPWGSLDWLAQDTLAVHQEIPCGYHALKRALKRGDQLWRYQPGAAETQEGRAALYRQEAVEFLRQRASGQR